MSLLRAITLIASLQMAQKNVHAENEVPCWLGGDNPNHQLTTEVAVLKSFSLGRNLESPVEDANKFFEIGDYRILAIGGFSIEYPSVEENELVCILGGNYVDGTSDGIESEEHSLMIQKVTWYAKRYNEEMIRLYQTRLSPNKSQHPTP